MRIKALATTKKGQSGFTLLNPELFKEELSQMDGIIEITISKVSEDATDQQKKMMHVLLQAFINKEESEGEILSEREAEIFLLRNVCKFLKGSISDLSKDESSQAIDRIKQFFSENNITF